MRVVEVLADLVALPSVNPIYDLESAGEAAMADHVEAWARGLGLQVRRQTVFSGRDNMVVRLAGPVGAPVLAFEAHMDTVGVTGMDAPFAPTVEDGRLTGRGSCDTKGSLAAMMVAIEELVAAAKPLACTVELIAAVDEETSGAGANAHVQGGAKADAAVIGEPTSCQVVFEHNGCVRGEISVIGRAAHTSVAGEGINAIEGMASVIQSLAAVNAQLAASPGGAADNGSLTVSLIEGGSGINVVPERCTINYDRRITPGQTSQGALAEIDAALDEVRQANGQIAIERPEPWFVGDPLATPATDPIVALGVAANAALGGLNTPVRVPYGSDASKFAAAGIPAIVFGPGSIDNAHSVTEYVPVDDLVAAVAFYRGLAERFGA
jgi:acetylornithine deacetylase